jgi:MFS family permease
MKSGVPARSIGIGLAGSVSGLLALILVALPLWDPPAPQTPSPAAAEVHQTLKERIDARLKSLGHKGHKARVPLGWRDNLPAVVIVFALLAIFLGVMSVLRAEALLYSGVAATLGIGAIAFQMSFFYAVAACVMLIMYAALERPGGAFSVAFIAVCAILVPAVLALLGTGLVPVLLLIGAAMAAVCLDMFLGGHKNSQHTPRGGWR